MHARMVCVCVRVCFVICGCFSAIHCRPPPPLGVYLHSPSKLFPTPPQHAPAPTQFPKIIKSVYHTLRLCHYFTAGSDEVKGWTIRVCLCGSFPFLSPATIGS